MADANDWMWGGTPRKPGGTNGCNGKDRHGNPRPRPSTNDGWGPWRNPMVATPRALVLLGIVLASMGGGGGDNEGGCLDRISQYASEPRA